MLSALTLNGYLGKSMADICPNGYTASHEPHGAHFVAHLLDLRYGLTCQMKSRGPVVGVCVRVEEIFAQCRKVGVWSLRPASLSTCLVFVGNVAHINLSAKMMSSPARKHVGLLVDGAVWHYADRQGRVLRQSPAEFAATYPAPDNAMFFGVVR